MRGLDDIIARDTILGKRADGSSFTIIVEIGRPFLWGDVSPTEWACAVNIDPLQSTTSHGEGSLQALGLALQWVRSQLNHFKENGGRLTWEDGQEWRLEDIWPPGPY